LRYVDPTGMAAEESDTTDWDNTPIVWLDEVEVTAEPYSISTRFDHILSESRKSTMDAFRMSGQFYGAAYSITGPEYNAIMQGRDFVTLADIKAADDAALDLAMLMVPAAGVAKLARQGYRLTRVVGGRFYVFERVVPARNLSGEARAVYVKIVTPEGRTVRMYKDAHRIDGRFYERKFYKPDFPPAR